MAAVKVIIDTDPGIDDAMAILFAILHEDIDLIGMTTILYLALEKPDVLDGLKAKASWVFELPPAHATETPAPEDNTDITDEKR